jgi:hypothetical protein
LPVGQRLSPCSSALKHAETAERKAAATTPAQRVFAGVATRRVVAAAVTAWLLWEIALIPG